MAFIAVGCGEPAGTEMTLSLSFGEKTGIYNGEVNEEGLPDGNGTFTSKNSEGVEWVYTGQFVDGHFEGEGETTWENGDREAGVYHDDILQLEPKENIDKMYLGPEDYKDHYFELTGQVYNVVGIYDGVLVFQMNEDIDNFGHNTTAYTMEDIDLEHGDYVRIKGFVQGIEDYENVSGGTSQAVLFLCESIEKIDYIDASSPTIKSVKVNESQSQYGYKVTVQKVEFSEIETRVYVRIDNDGKSEVSFFSHNAVAVQNGKQISSGHNYNADYPDFETSLKPGNYTEAIIVFNGLDQKDFTFVISGLSFDGWESMKDYKIEVKVD